jgi:hypothetical protein
VAPFGGETSSGAGGAGGNCVSVVNDHVPEPLDPVLFFATTRQ